MTMHIGTVTVADGYNGAIRTLYLCREFGGRVLGVYEHGWIIFADSLTIPA